LASGCDSRNLVALTDVHGSLPVSAVVANQDVQQDPPRRLRRYDAVSTNSVGPYSPIIALVHVPLDGGSLYAPTLFAEVKRRACPIDVLLLGQMT
jgi:hypothetical protein